MEILSQVSYPSYTLQVDIPSSISRCDFVTCWVNFDKGSFVVGLGQPGAEPQYSWTDPDPVQGIQHVGLGSWDKHVCFRNINIRPTLTSRQPCLSPVRFSCISSLACSWSRVVTASCFIPDTWTNNVNSPRQ